MFLIDGGDEPVNQKSTECCGQSCEEMRRTVCVMEIVQARWCRCVQTPSELPLSALASQHRSRECLRS